MRHEESAALMACAHAEWTGKLLGEFATVVRYGLPIKIVVMKNNTLGHIKWEQLLFLGNVEYECALQPIDFAAVAGGFGIAGFRAQNATELVNVLEVAFGMPGAALIEATVDPNEPLLPAKRMSKYAENLEKALAQCPAGAAKIRAALAREPQRSHLAS